MGDKNETEDQYGDQRQQLAIEYYLKLYDDAMARYRALDIKAARSLPAFALLLTLMGFIGSQIGQYSLATCWIVAVGFFSIAGILCAMGGIGFLVRGMQTQPTSALPNHEKTYKAFKTKPLQHLAFSIANNARKAAKQIHSESDEKAKDVNRGLQLWLPTSIFVLLSVGILATVGDRIPSSETGVSDHSMNDQVGGSPNGEDDQVVYNPPEESPGEPVEPNDDVLGEPIQVFESYSPPGDDGTTFEQEE